MSTPFEDVDVNEAPPVQGFDKGGPTSPFSDISIVDVLREEVKELAENKTCFIPITGYGRTNLMVQYHLPEKGKELDDIARKVNREQKDQYYRNIYTAMDTMAWLCSGLFVNPDNAYPEPVMLDPQETGEPVMFDSRLAELMGLESDNGVVMSARAVIKRLFGNNDMAILTHAEKLGRWLANTKADLSLEIWQLGEA